MQGLIELLCDRFQLPEERFAVVGRADTAPVDTNETEEGRARNRRVDLVIVNILGTRQVPGKSDVVLPQAKRSK